MQHSGSQRPNRRRVLAAAAGAAALPLSGSLLGAAALARSPATAPQRAGNGDQSRLNIVFVFTDQERYRAGWPPGLSLPGHERLQRSGVSFLNHYCPAVMCTSSRAVLLTGLQTTDNGMFENCDVPWVEDLSTSIPTIGHMLRHAGYYTAYKGKWHLNREFDGANPDRLLNEEMEQYGFADFNSPGDLVGHTLGGYFFDDLIASSAITWLRRKGRPLADQGQPWCLFVSLVNPHDIMYFNTDAPGQKVQDTGNLFMHAARAPEHELYRAKWDVPLPDSLTQPFDTPGRPKAHGEFQRSWDYVLGQIPPEPERWQRFNDFYINSSRAVDGQLVKMLRELDALGLTDRTIFVFTSDHGEMAGAHGLRGKGPFAYQQNIHLPFYVVHPDVNGGQQCRSLSGHIDMVPTLLAMAGVGATKRAEVAGRELPGKDLTPLLTSPGTAGLHAVREGVLFTYSGLATNDSGLWRIAAEAKASAKSPVIALLKQGYVPDLKKRGSLRTAFDGRYKFSRYFSPLDYNRPSTIDELYQANDLELFDLSADPDEMVNLAREPTKNTELVLSMSNKLETLIKAEVGIDDGRELPNIPFVTWTIDRVS